MSTQALSPQWGAGSADTGLGNRGPESKSVIVPYGFWLFILSDIIMFSALFAGCAVLVHETNRGPSGRELFDLGNVGVETVSLLLSSFVCGLAWIATKRANVFWAEVGFLLTGLLGFVFLLLELREFGSMILAGNGP